MLVFGGVRRCARAVRCRLARDAHDVVLVVHDHDHEHGSADERGVDPLHDHAHAIDEAPLGRGRPATAAAVGAVAVGARHRHLHAHAGPMPDDPFPSYGRRTAFGIGMLHGIGAETPTQVIVFAAAAGAGGAVAGVVVLIAFLVGLLVSNTAVAVAATFGFLGAGRNFGVYATISVVTAVFSLIVGALFVSGTSAALPSILGG
jgi:hypothetical protein